VAENNYTGAYLRPKGAKKNSAPPLYFSAPGEETKARGQTLLHKEQNN